MRAETDPTDYLVATAFIDSEAENVVAFARHVVGDEIDEVARGTGFCVGKACDVFYCHGYAEFFLRNRWVKATPAFDRALCERFGVHALEFDGVTDSLFQPDDRLQPPACRRRRIP